jgi:hypothetical protein
MLPLLLRDGPVIIEIRAKEDLSADYSGLLLERLEDGVLERNRECLAWSTLLADDAFAVAVFILRNRKPRRVSVEPAEEGGRRTLCSSWYLGGNILEHIGDKVVWDAVLSVDDAGKTEVEVLVFLGRNSLDHGQRSPRSDSVAALIEGNTNH